MKNFLFRILAVFVLVFSFSSAVFAVSSDVFSGGTGVVEIEDVETEDTVDLENTALNEGLSDIQNHKFEISITYLFENGIINGYPDGTFRPEKDVNRAEFVKMIVNSRYDVDEESFGNCFPDVKDEWYAPYVCFAKENGIIGGYDDGTFKPSQTINFAEAAKILVRTNALKENLYEGKIWYEVYVETLEELKYIPTTITSVNKNVNRGELSEMLWRILEKKSDQSANTELIVEITTGPSDWATNTKDGFSFDHPNWVGYERHGWDYLSDEMKNITGLDTGDYITVDTYLAHYSVGASGDDASALNTNVWFSHPLVKSEYMTVNGLPAMMREYRAYPGDVMNGRTVGYDEVLLLYTYRIGDKVKVLQFFNAHPPTQDAYIEIYKEIAKTVRAS